LAASARVSERGERDAGDEIELGERADAAVAGFLGHALDVEQGVVTDRRGGDKAILPWCSK
jgi:hypothetical protein